MKFRHAFLFGDTHLPFQDDAAIKCIKSLIADVKPDILIHMGDLVDCYSISDFDKEPLRKESLQDEIDEGAKLLKELYILTPGAKRYYLEGNHEARLTRTINRMKEAQREVVKLRVFQAHVSWPGVLEEAGVSKQMWEFVPTRGQARRRIFPRFVVKHGSVVSKRSGATGFREMDRYGMSGASGHTHRLGDVFHNDFNGAHRWLETGCTCDLTPEYAEDPDWQQGCVVVTFTSDYRFFNPEVVYIQEGNAIWRDTRIKI